MDSLLSAQSWVAFLLGLALFVMELYALIDCARRPAQAFPYADKRTKGVWLAVTAICAAVGFVMLRSPMNFIALLAVVGSAVYLVDVRPAVSMYRPRSKGSNSGPYGSW